MRGRAWKWLLILMGLLLTLGIARAEGLDAVIVVDQSLSMTQSETRDPYGFRMDAASLFLSMMDMADSRVSLLTYNKSVTTVTRGMEISGSSVQMRDKLMLTLEKRTENTASGSDHGMALRAAVNLFGGSTDERTRVVLMIMDGDHEGGVGRTAEISRKDMEQAVKDAKARGVRLYFVCLKDKEGSYRKIRSQVEDAARSTGGIAYFPDQASAIPECVINIYAENVLQIKSFRADQTTKMVDSKCRATLHIPNNSAEEITVIVPRSAENRDVVLKRLGNEVPVDNQRVFRFDSRNYTVYKILWGQRMVGAWTVEYEQNDTLEHDVRVLIDYRMEASMSMSRKGKISRRDGLTAFVKFMKGSRVISDADVYKNSSITATATVRRENQIVWTDLMTAQGDGFSASIPLGDMRQGDYTLEVRVSGGCTKGWTFTEPFSVTNQAPRVIAQVTACQEAVIRDPLDQTDTTPEAFEAILRIADYVIDPDGDPLRYSVDEAQTDARLLEQLALVPAEEMLIIRNNPDLSVPLIEGTLVLRVFDADNAETTLKVPVKITDRKALYEQEYRVVLDYSPRELYKGDTVKLTATLLHGTEKVTDLNILNQIHLNLTVEGQPVTVPLNDPDGLDFVTEKDKGKRYTYAGWAKLGSAAVQVELVNLTAQNRMPRQREGTELDFLTNLRIFDLAQGDTTGFITKRIDLKQYFYDPDGDPLRCTVPDCPWDRLEVTWEDAEPEWEDDRETQTVLVVSTLGLATKENGTLVLEVRDQDYSGYGDGVLKMEIPVSIVDARESFKSCKLNLRAEPAEVEKGGTVHLTVTLEDAGGTLITDPEVLSRCKITVAANRQGQQAPIALESNGHGVFTASVAADCQAGAWMLWPTAELFGSVSVTADEATTVLVRNQAPRRVEEKGEILALNDMRINDPLLDYEDGRMLVRISLKEYFMDPDGDGLIFSVREAPSNVLAYITDFFGNLTPNGQFLTVTALSTSPEGTGHILVDVCDNDPLEPRQTDRGLSIPVNVRDVREELEAGKVVLEYAGERDREIEAGERMTFKAHLYVGGQETRDERLLEMLDIVLTRDEIPCKETFQYDKALGKYASVMAGSSEGDYTYSGQARISNINIPVEGMKIYVGNRLPVVHPEVLGKQPDKVATEPFLFHKTMPGTGWPVCTESVIDLTKLFSDTKGEQLTYHAYIYAEGESLKRVWAPERVDLTKLKSVGTIRNGYLRIRHDMPAGCWIKGARTLLIVAEDDDGARALAVYYVEMLSERRIALVCLIGVLALALVVNLCVWTMKNRPWSDGYGCLERINGAANLRDKAFPREMNFGARRRALPLNRVLCLGDFFEKNDRGELINSKWENLYSNLIRFASKSTMKPMRGGKLLLRFRGEIPKECIITLDGDKVDMRKTSKLIWKMNGEMKITSESLEATFRRYEA